LQTPGGITSEKGAVSKGGKGSKPLTGKAKKLASAAKAGAAAGKAKPKACPLAKLLKRNL
jgi:hypothetical protein